MYLFHPLTTSQQQYWPDAEPHFSSPVPVNNREVSSGKRTSVSLNVCVRTRWYFWVSTRPEAILTPCYELRPSMLNLSGTKIWGSNVSYSVTAAPSTAFKLGILFSSIFPWRYILGYDCVCISKCHKPKSYWLLNIFQFLMDLLIVTTTSYTSLAEGETARTAWLKGRGHWI